MEIIENKNFFETPPYGGEMLPYERYKLYNYVLKTKPNIVLETGTGIGGGSTYYILKALEYNNHGKLYTCDPFRSPNIKLINEFKKFIDFNRMSSNFRIKKMIKENIIPDFIFFDGPEDPNVALEDIKLIEEYLKTDTIFSMHDWCTEKRKYDNNISTKSLLIKPYLNQSKNWELIEELSGLIKNSNFDNTGYDSVGLVFYKKI